MDIIFYARNGNLQKVKECLEKGVNINIKNRLGYTPLMSALRNPHFEVVKLLVEDGAVHLNIQDEVGFTPLMWASSCHGHLEIVKSLVEKGANLNIKNKWGYTALMMVARHGPVEIV